MASKYTDQLGFKPVGGVYSELPLPPDEEGAFVWDHEEVCDETDTTRSESAKMNKDVIDSKRSLTINYSCIKRSEYAAIFKAIKGTGTNSGRVVYGDLTYPDVETDGNQTRRVYTGGRLTFTYKFRDYETGEIYGSVEIKFIEV